MERGSLQGSIRMGPVEGFFKGLHKGCMTVWGLVSGSSVGWAGRGINAYPKAGLVVIHQDPLFMFMSAKLSNHSARLREGFMICDKYE